jgi:hypothetical protein
LTDSAEQLYYIEFYERVSGIPLDEFHRTDESFREWSRRYPQDELVANLARTWRIGQHSHLLIWGGTGFERLAEWDEIFRSSTVDDLEIPLLSILQTPASGFYRDLVTDLPRPGAGPFYLEAFRPSEVTEASYRTRRLPQGATLNLVIERIGLFGPPPGGFALFSVDSLSRVGDLHRSAPAQVESIGLYETAGSEIL